MGREREDAMTTSDETTELVLERRLRAPVERVWAAWTEPALLARWFSPHGACEVLDADLRVGGGYHIKMTAPDGEIHQVLGRYREIVPPGRLTFTWAWITTPERESLVEIDLVADGAETRLTLRHSRFADQPARDRHEGGWTFCLAHLDSLLAADLTETAE